MEFATQFKKSGGAAGIDFDNYDSDDNGLFSKEEWDAKYGNTTSTFNSYERYDLDADTVVSRDEFISASENYGLLRDVEKKRAKRHEIAVNRFKWSPWNPKTKKLVEKLKLTATTTEKPHIHLKESSDVGTIELLFTQDMIIPEDFKPDEHLVTLELHSDIM